MNDLCARVRLRAHVASERGGSAKRSCAEPNGSSAFAMTAGGRSSAVKAATASASGPSANRSKAGSSTFFWSQVLSMRLTARARRRATSRPKQARLMLLATSESTAGAPFAVPSSARWRSGCVPATDWMKRSKASSSIRCANASSNEMRGNPRLRGCRLPAWPATARKPAAADYQGSQALASQAASPRSRRSKRAGLRFALGLANRSAPCGP